MLERCLFSKLAGNPVRQGVVRFDSFMNAPKLPTTGKLLRSSPLFFLPMLLLCGCGATATPIALGQAAAPTPTAPAANPFSRVVVLGDSISAGFQNGSLLDRQQPNGWASLLAAQAGFSLTLPLMAPPGFPAVYQLVGGTFPPVVEQEPGITPGRDNPRATINDFAVPGHNLYQLLNAAPVAEPATATEQMTSYVLGYPAGASGTQVQQALRQQPTLVYLWIGGDDALPALPTGDPSQMTPVSTFASEFAQLLSTLQAGTHAHLMVANVPDVTEIAYMTSATSLLELFSKVTGLPQALFSAAFHIYPGDLLNAQGLQDLEVDVKRVEALQLPFPLPAGDVLTAANVAVVQSTINGYNEAISLQVAAAGGTVVDMHALIDSWAADGITINGYHAQTTFLGGMFGLDGIHPTNTGYAVLANQWISSTNAALGTTVPLVDLSAVAAQDPLFGPAVNSGTAAQGSTPEIVLPAVPVGSKAAQTLLFGLRESK